MSIGARVAGLAGPGEVLVSDTVRQLLVGSDFSFDDRGTHTAQRRPGSLGRLRRHRLSAEPAGSARGVIWTPCGKRLDRRAGTSLAIAALLLAACGRESGPGASASTGARSRPTQRQSERATVAASTAHRSSASTHVRTLLEHLRDRGLQARRTVRPARGRSAARSRVDSATADGAAGAAQRADSAARRAPPPRRRTSPATNVQEASVDEPDIVKTNGRHIFTLRTGPERRRSVSGSSSIALDGEARGRRRRSDAPRRAYGYQLLARRRPHPRDRTGGRLRDRSRHRTRPRWSRRPPAASTSARSSRSSTSPIRRTCASRNKLELDGTYASARMVGGIARIVLNSSSRTIAFDAPTEPTATRSAQRSTTNKQRSTQADARRLASPLQAAGRRRARSQSKGTLASCDSTFHPKTFSGFGDDERRDASIRAIRTRATARPSSVGRNGLRVDDNLYVATQRWPEPQPLVIERSADRRAASRSPAPREDRAAPLRHLRPARARSTRRPVRCAAPCSTSGRCRSTTATSASRRRRSSFGADGRRRPASFVTVLDATAPKLDEGRPHQRHRSRRAHLRRPLHRAISGYVVTFRQIDPLHVDRPLRSREARSSSASSKIPGYSAYLHPVGDGLLLGVGHDADLGRPSARRRQSRSSTCATRRRRSDWTRRAANDTYTQVEYDHHAFTWWEPERLALVPVELQNVIAEPVSPDGREIAPDKAAADVVPVQLPRRGRRPHQGRASDARGARAAVHGTITRSIVVGDTLYSLSGAGVAASDLGSLAERALAPAGLVVLLVGVARPSAFSSLAKPSDVRRTARAPSRAPARPPRSAASVRA